MPEIVNTQDPNAPLKIVRVDRGYRRRLFLWYLSGMLIAGMCLLAVRPAHRFIFSHDIITAFRYLEGAAIVFLLLFSIPAVYLIRTGRKILRHGSFPFPGMKVIRDTIILEGAEAGRRGKALIALGILSIFMSISGIVLTHVMFERWKNDPIFRPLFNRAEYQKQ